MTALYVVVAFVLGALAWDTFLGWLHTSIDAATSLPAAEVRPVTTCRQRSWSA